MQTTDIIIIAIISILMGFGGYKMWLQLSGKKTCCGGTKEKVESKKLKNIIGAKIVHINGMSCDHCKNSVTKAINSIEGASGKVNLSKNIAVVSFDREISDEEITKVIEKIGFKVEKITE